MSPDLSITPIPAFADNYLWLLQRGDDAVVVDPGDAAPVQHMLTARGLKLAAIVVTHHHGDHIGGITELVQRWQPRVYGPATEQIPQRQFALREGAHFTELGTRFEVLDVPGHTAGHIAYLLPEHNALFCGDTLFACGCGRLFEGTPTQMVQSLAKLAALPAATRVYCAHEYTLSNIRFALAVEPNNAALQARAQICDALRARGVPTVPSTIADELATNPFLRCTEPAVRAAAVRADASAGADPVATFAALRAWKNRF